MATITKWIKDYCELNDITMPTGVEDEETAIMFLKLNKGNGGGNSDFPKMSKTNILSVDNGYIELDLSVNKILADFQKNELHYFIVPTEYNLENWMPDIPYVITTCYYESFGDTYSIISIPVAPQTDEEFTAGRVGYVTSLDVDENIYLN